MPVTERKRIAVRPGAPLVVSYWLRMTETIAGVQQPGESAPRLSVLHREEGALRRLSAHANLGAVNR